MDECKSERMDLNLSAAVYRELSGIAIDRSGSMTDVIRFALGLAKVAFHETAVGHKLIVTTADGTPLKEIIVPDQL